MAKPSILAVDDEPQVLNAVVRDIRARFGRDYRVLKAGSGQEALQLVQELKKRNEPLALFVVDQRMPEMTGTEFLAEARKYYPDARKMLLTAYADTQAAIESINTIELDYYLLKPWHPPEQHLYPVVEDLLSDWAATAEMPYEGIRVAGTLWSPTSHRVKDFLARNRIPYQWLDIEKDEEARTLFEAVTDENYSMPAVFFPDGTVLIDPGSRELAEKLGMHTDASDTYYDLIIVGAGPAGLGAAVYGASEGLRTALIEREATGGQAGTSSRIENYLGFPKGLSGADLARRATAQAERLGAEILIPQEVCGIRAEDPYRIVRLVDGTELTCRALVLATGVNVRRLDAPGVAELTGRGVYYGAAVTEAAYYVGEHIVVIGGANSAGQSAMFFSRFARKVTLLVRSSSLERGMSHYLVHQIHATDNIEVRLRTELVAAHGENRLEAVTYVNRNTGEQTTEPAAALFIFIGAVPYTEMIAGAVECNAAGFILTGPDLMKDGRRPPNWKLKRDPYLLETSMPGVFAVGDVRQGAVRRVASAVGEGAIVVSQIHQYLQTV